MNENSTFEVTARVGRKGTWQASLEDDALSLTPVEGNETFQIPRDEVEEKVEIRNLLFANPLLVVRVPKKTIVFELEKSHASTLKEWMGPPTIDGLKFALKRRLGWCLPIGILFVITSIPLPAIPEQGIEAVPFDAVSAFLGVSLIALAVLGRTWPRRILFLLDGVWFSLLALQVAYGIMQGDSLWWCIAVLFLVLGAKGGFSEYVRFASLTPQRENS